MTACAELSSPPGGVEIQSPDSSVRTPGLDQHVITYGHYRSTVIRDIDREVDCANAGPFQFLARYAMGINTSSCI